MNILLDECMPKRFKQFLFDHKCVTVPERGWAGIKNGTLLSKAEDEFDVFITVDRNLSFQNQILDRKIAVIVIKSKRTDYGSLAPLESALREALKSAQAGVVTLIG